MAEGKSKEGKGKKGQQTKVIFVSLVTLILIFVYIIVKTDTTYPFDIPIINELSDKITEVFSPKGASPAPSDTSPNSTPTSTTGEMSVHIIDIGQGSSTLFLSNDRTILIDAGENGTGKTIKNYLNNLGIDSIDLFIATHPHSDHIGGMDELMNTIDLQTIIMPEIPSNILPTTKTYLDVLQMIDKQNKEITIAESGNRYVVGDMNVEILGPVEKFDDLNDISIISKISYGDTSVLVTGDAEKPAELATLSKFRSSLSSQIYIVGHHGSSTSSTKEFLEAINPKYAAISLGKSNSYGHPHKEVLSLLGSKNIEYYRTDERGSIIFNINNNDISVVCEK